MPREPKLLLQNSHNTLSELQINGHHFVTTDSTVSIVIPPQTRKLEYQKKTWKSTATMSNTIESYQRPCTVMLSGWTSYNNRNQCSTISNDSV